MLETEALNQTDFLNLFKLLNLIQMSVSIEWTIQIKLETICTTLFDNLHKRWASLTLYLVLIVIHSCLQIQRLGIFASCISDNSNMVYKIKQWFVVDVFVKAQQANPLLSFAETFRWTPFTGAFTPNQLPQGPPIDNFQWRERRNSKIHGEQSKYGLIFGMNPTNLIQ